MATKQVDVKRPAPVPANPTDVWSSLRGEMDRVFERFTGVPSLSHVFGVEPPGRPTAFTLPAPAVDITEDDAAYTLTAELPGTNEKDIEVAVSGDRLTIKGEKQQETEETNKNVHVSERSYGLFQRSFSLPSWIDVDGIGAAFAKGVLTVTLPKTAKAVEHQKKIEVKSAG